MLPPRALALAFLACVALARAGSAQCELQSVVPGGDIPPTDGSGWKIAQSGRTFAVAGEGRVHVYRQDGLTAFLAQEIAVPGFVPDLVTIAALALDGNTLAVALQGLRIGEPNVHVYERRAGTWVHSNLLDPARNEFWFGRALALGGGRLFVAANEEDRRLPNPGVVYVYERVAGTWTRVDRLKPLAESRLEGFGECLDVEGDRLAVGVTRGPSDPPHAYVYDRTAAGWEQHDVRSARLAPRGFGFQLDLRGDVLMISGSSSDPGGIARVFEFDGTTWQETAELVTGDTLEFPGTSSVAIVDESMVLVGDARNSERRAAGGVVYAFEKLAGSWQETRKLFPSSSFFWQGHGARITCEDGLAVLGTVYADCVRTFSARGTGCRTLAAFPPVVSLTSGGTHTLRLEPGREFAGMRYYLLGSATGFEPGFRFQGWRVPLVPDRYLASSLPGQRRLPFVDNIGLLDARTGKATVTLDVPPLTHMALAGLDLYHAFLVLDRGVVRHVSNVRTLTLGP